MIKAVFRFLGLLILALALITAVLDIARSIADSTVIMTPLGKDWYDLSVNSLNLAQATVQRYLHPLIWDPVVQGILQLPSWIVFTAIALLFLWIGRKKRRNWHQNYGA